MTITMFGYLILISMDFLSVFSLVLIEKIYQTLKAVFDHISKHLEVCQKYSVTCHISNSLGVWNCVQTQSLCLIYYILLLNNTSFFLEHDLPNLNMNYHSTLFKNQPHSQHLTSSCSPLSH